MHKLVGAMEYTSYKELKTFLIFTIFNLLALFIRYILSREHYGHTCYYYLKPMFVGFSPITVISLVKIF